MLCGDWIGVYEPVFVLEAEAERTSLAARPELRERDVAFVHADCWAKESD
ncbi:MAG TPA: hypothetical protein VGL78_03890 [Solirubrobacteraceae bacterium]